MNGLLGERWEEQERCRFYSLRSLNVFVIHSMNYMPRSRHESWKVSTAGQTVQAYLRRGAVKANDVSDQKGDMHPKLSRDKTMSDAVHRKNQSIRTETSAA